MKDSRYDDLIEATTKRGAANSASLFRKSVVDRRTFLQGAAFLGACGGLMGFGLTGCTPANTGGAAAQGWKAGTYSANVTGHNAPFTVDVTFSENAITAIDTSTNQESLGVGASALEDLSNKIMEYQTLNVDSVTGATLSSMSLQQGVKDCAEQANAAKTLAKAPGPDDSVESSYNADVCVVGGGGAGLTAAISAVQAGANVVVVEKCGITGGSTNVSEGARGRRKQVRQGRRPQRPRAGRSCPAAHPRNRRGSGVGRPGSVAPRCFTGSIARMLRLIHEARRGSVSDGSDVLRMTPMHPFAFEKAKSHRIRKKERLPQGLGSFWQEEALLRPGIMRKIVSRRDSGLRPVFRIRCFLAIGSLVGCRQKESVDVSREAFVRLACVRPSSSAVRPGELRK